MKLCTQRSRSRAIRLMTVLHDSVTWPVGPRHNKRDAASVTTTGKPKGLWQRSRSRENYSSRLLGTAPPRHPPPESVSAANQPSSSPLYCPAYQFTLPSPFRTQHLRFHGTYCFCLVRERASQQQGIPSVGCVQPLDPLLITSCKIDLPSSKV